VSVTDSGSGVPACDRERIFDPGFRGNTSETTGAGLGLAISKKIADWHNGELALAENTAGGAQFEFTLAPVQSASYRPDLAT